MINRNEKIREGSISHFFIAVFFVLATLTACSHSEQKTKKEEDRVVKAATKETEARDFAEIKFNEGSATLSENAKASLNTVLRKAKKEGDIDEVIVLSWADRDYPSKDLKKLSKEERDLADQRNKNVKEYLKTMKDVDVDSYNMAERPSAFSRLFNTADSELKDSMLEAGLSTTADKADYTSKASHSVILIKTKK